MRKRISVFTIFLVYCGAQYCVAVASPCVDYASLNGFLAREDGSGPMAGALIYRQPCLYVATSTGFDVMDRAASTLVRVRISQVTLLPFRLP